MAWSWVRVSTATSPKLRDCMGADPSAGKFEECVAKIVESHNGRVENVKFEPNGKRARVLFEWGNREDWLAILFDLQAEEVHDLLSGDEIDALRGLR